MPRKEIVRVDLAVANPNLSPATKFGNLVFVAGQTGRHPVTAELGRDIREQTRFTVPCPATTSGVGSIAWSASANERPSKLLFAAARQPGNQNGHHRT